MASLFKSLTNWFREKKDQAAEAVGDDIRDAKYAIEDSKAQIGKFRSDIAKFVAANKSVQRDLDGALSDVNKWSKVVEAATAAGNLDDANTAQTEVDNAKRRAIEFKKQVTSNDAAITNLRSQLAKAERKVNDAESDHIQLSARKKGAQIRKELAAASNKFGTGDSPLSQLDDLRRKVEADEDVAESMEEMNVSVSDNLADKYSVSSSSTDDEFAKMFG